MIRIEVRKKIIEARKNGAKIKELVKAYGYSESAIQRLLRLERTKGYITPQTHLRGRKPELDDVGMKKLKELIRSKPDMTLEEIKEELHLKIGITAISEIVRKKLGFRFKKRQYMLQSEDDLM